MATPTGPYMIFAALIIYVTMVGAVTSEKHACNVEGALRCVPPLDLSRLVSPQFSFVIDMMLPTGLCLDKLLHGDCARTYNTPEVKLGLKVLDHLKSIDFMTEIQKFSQCNRHTLAYVSLCVAKFAENFPEKKCHSITLFEKCLSSMITENCDQDIATVQTLFSYFKESADCPHIEETWSTRKIEL